MSDISIPGVGTGKYDKLVETLMKKERVPRDRAAKQLKTYQIQSGSLAAVNKFSLDLRDVARSLYSFNNPFAEKLVSSSNEAAISATAGRDAKERNFQISVVQTAEADAFLSAEIDKNYKIPKGTYTFGIGDKTLSVNWKGGNYKDFIERVNSKGKGLLQVTEIKTTPETRSLLFKSLIPGKDNRLQFSDDALSFALQAGIIKKNDSATVQVDKVNLQVQPQSTAKAVFSQPVRAKDGSVLECTVQLNSSQQASSAQQEHSLDESGNPIYETPGEVSFKGVTVKNELSQAGLPPSIPDENTPQSGAAQQRRYDLLFLESVRGVALPMPPLADTTEPQKITIPLSEYGDVTALSVQNTNADVHLSIQNIKIIDPKVSGDYVPVSAVSQAQDAIINFEGIQITRSTNEINDLIPSVTLSLHDKTDKKETISIKPDIEAIKTSVIEFVAKYNRLLAEINIVTARKPAQGTQSKILEELTYLSEDERKVEEERLGSLSNDMTLLTLKNNLRQHMSNIYITDPESPIKSLAQIGISTNSEMRGGIQASRLRGYLEIDEKKLDDALKNNMELVKRLFGSDTDGDLLVDEGVAYQLYTQLNPYLERGGIFSTKANGISTRIGATEKRIEGYDKQLDKKEKDLKYKYEAMDGTLRSLQKQSESITNFNKSLQNQNKGN